MRDPGDLKARGQQAQNLLRDEMLMEALKAVRFAAHRAFEQAKGDHEKLDRASRQLEAANTFQRFLTVAMNQGAEAAKRMDRELQAGRFVRGIGRMVRSRDDMAEGMPWSSAS